MIYWIIGLFLIGALLGSLYLMGLWFTIKKLPSTKYPVRLITLSFVARMSVLLYLFYFFMDKDWQKAIILLSGFLVVRIAAHRYINVIKMKE